MVTGKPDGGNTIYKYLMQYDVAERTFFSAFLVENRIFYEYYEYNDSNVSKYHIYPVSGCDPSNIGKSNRV